MVDRFTSVAVAYENGLATEEQLKKNACTQVAVLIRLKEAESLAVQHLIDGFTEVIKAEREQVEGAVNKVCADLYAKINETKE